MTSCGSLTRGRREAGLSLRERVTGTPPRIFGHEVLLMLLHGVACWLVGRRIPILRAQFALPASPRTARNIGSCTARI